MDDKNRAYQLWQEARALADKLARRSHNKSYTKKNQLRYLRLFQKAHLRALRRWNLYRDI